jgi:hypothetical protein
MASIRHSRDDQYRSLLQAREPVIERAISSIALNARISEAERSRPITEAIQRADDLVHKQIVRAIVVGQRAPGPSLLKELQGALETH